MPSHVLTYSFHSKAVTLVINAAARCHKYSDGHDRFTRAPVVNTSRLFRVGTHLNIICYRARDMISNKYAIAQGHNLPEHFLYPSQTYTREDGWTMAVYPAAKPSS